MPQTTGLLALFPLQILGAALGQLTLPCLQYIIPTHLKASLGRQGHQFGKLHR